MDSNKYWKILKESGNISKEVVLIIDEMFLQRSEEFVGGNLIVAVHCTKELHHL